MPDSPGLLPNWFRAHARPERVCIALILPRLISTSTEWLRRHLQIAGPGDQCAAYALDRLCNCEPRLATLNSHSIGFRCTLAILKKFPALGSSRPRSMVEMKHRALPTWCLGELGADYDAVC
jgi:hypothetical protein